MDKEYITDSILQNEKENNKVPQPARLTEEEIKQRLSGRSWEYVMFMDD